MSNVISELLATEVALDKLGARGISTAEIGQLARNRHAKLTISVSVGGEDARRLERLAAARGQRPGDVVADLLRAADRPAA